MYCEANSSVECLLMKPHRLLIVTEEISMSVPLSYYTVLCVALIFPPHTKGCVPGNWFTDYYSDSTNPLASLFPVHISYITVGYFTDLSLVLIVLQVQPVAIIKGCWVCLWRKMLTLSFYTSMEIQGDSFFELFYVFFVLCSVFVVNVFLSSLWIFEVSRT